MTSETIQETYINEAGTNWSNWWQTIQAVVQYRFLLRNLVIRDVKVRYKNSILGIVWSMLNPLLMMLVYTVLFTVLIPNNMVRHYPVFILVGIVAWNFFGGTLVGGATSITSNGALITKVHFPRVILPLATVFSNLVNFLFAFVVLLIFLFAYGIGLSIHALWVPVILLTQVIFLMGLSMLLATFQVFYRDVLMILDVGLLAWFFLTPIFYPFEQLGETATLLGITFSPAVVMRWLNPMASIVDSYRTVLWGTMGSNGPASMDPSFLLRTFVTAVITLIIGYTVFIRLEHLFGEKL